MAGKSRGSKEWGLLWGDPITGQFCGHGDGLNMLPGSRGWCGAFLTAQWLYQWTSFFSFWWPTGNGQVTVFWLWAHYDPLHLFIWYQSVSYDITMIQVFKLFEMEATSCTRVTSCVTINYKIGDKPHKYQLCRETPDTVLGNVCWTLHTVSTPKTIMFSFGKPERGNQQMCQQKSLDR